MKIRKVKICILAAAALACALLGGCGKSAETGGEAETAQESFMTPEGPEESAPGTQEPETGQEPETETETDTQPPAQAGGDSVKEEQADGRQAVTGGTDAGEDGAASGQQVLNGNVVSVDGDTFVINKAEVDDNVMVLSDEVNAVNIHMASHVKIIIKTVKNAGVNPSDITETAGSTADIQTDASVVITGNWSGDVFEAGEIVVYHFI